VISPRSFVRYAKIPTCENVLTSIYKSLTTTQKKAARAIKNNLKYRQNIISRHLLQACTEGALNITSDSFILSFPKFSRPEFHSDFNEADISLSLSHSGNWVAVAVGINCVIGLDILDATRPKGGFSIADHYFHDNEKKLLANLQETDRRVVFQKLWCAKEAMVKVKGCDLSDCLGLDFSGVIGLSENISLDGVVFQAFKTPGLLAIGVVAVKSVEQELEILIERAML
jgi:phosphopantetheinyl transferase